MAEENDLIFREEQRFPLWLRLLLIVSMVFMVALGGFALRDAVSKQGTADVLPLILLIVTMIILPIAVAALFLIMKLETEVRSDGLHVRFFPIHIRYKKFTADDLGEYYARTYRPILEYGGWGIRYSLGKSGKAYNVSGNKGVQLILRNGKRLLIGSQKCDELAEALSSIMESS